MLVQLAIHRSLIRKHLLIHGAVLAVERWLTCVACTFSCNARVIFVVSYMTLEFRECSRSWDGL